MIRRRDSSHGEGILKKVSTFLLLVFLTGIFSIASGRINPYADEKRETIFDRVVHLEKELILNIPRVPRLCDLFSRLGHLKPKWVNIGDCSLYCEEDGRGTALVVLHGGPGATHHLFHPYFILAASFSKVIYYDQRGCGISDYLEGKGYSVDQAADDLEALRKALKIDKWIVLGHSYGGLLAQYYAVKYPESVGGLVLVGSALAMFVPLKPTRQYDFLSTEERKKINEIHGNSSLTEQQSVYNAFLNGDWKRQNFYKPNPDKMAQIALYEWKYAYNFRNAMGVSIQKVDLEGAFKNCPIPTLILEGRWDLTWNTDKPGKLQANHPSSQMVMFESSSHSPFDDEPVKFFQVLRDFVRGLPIISMEAVSQWKEYLAEWERDKSKSPAYILRAAGWGRKSNEAIVQLYSPDWIGQLKDPTLLLKLGFALYDLVRYEEALAVFRKMEEVSLESEDKLNSANAGVWQGHMLDLLGRRDEAILIYQKVVDMNVTSTVQHSQWGMQYAPSIYAAQRIKEPFKRIENLLAAYLRAISDLCGNA